MVRGLARPYGIGMVNRERHDNGEADGSSRNLHASENVFTGSFASMAGRAGSHFAGADDPADDRIEIWGKRIGRALSLIGVVGLSIYLYLTYFR